MSQKNDIKTEGTFASRSEIYLKWLGAIVAVITVGTSITNYIGTSNREYQKPFYDKQFKLYTEATQAASTLATSLDKAERDKAYQKFWHLYWGEMCMVEDRKVEIGMRAFGDQLRVHGPDFSPRTMDELSELQQRSFLLAHSCRESLVAAWPVPEGDIKRPVYQPETNRNPNLGVF